MGGFYDSLKRTRSWVQPKVFVRDQKKTPIENFHAAVFEIYVQFECGLRLCRLLHRQSVYCSCCPIGTPLADCTCALLDRHQKQHKRIVREIKQVGQLSEKLKEKLKNAVEGSKDGADRKIQAGDSQLTLEAGQMKMRQDNKEIINKIGEIAKKKAELEHNKKQAFKAMQVCACLGPNVRPQCSSPLIG